GRRPSGKHNVARSRVQSTGLFRTVVTSFSGMPSDSPSICRLTATRDVLCADEIDGDRITSATNNGVLIHIGVIPSPALTWPRPLRGEAFIQGIMSMLHRLGADEQDFVYGPGPRLHDPIGSDGDSVPTLPMEVLRIEPLRAPCPQRPGLTGLPWDPS